MCLSLQLTLDLCTGCLFLQLLRQALQSLGNFLCLLFLLLLFFFALRLLCCCFGFALHINLELRCLLLLKPSLCLLMTSLLFGLLTFRFFLLQLCLHLGLASLAFTFRSSHLVFLVRCFLLCLCCLVLLMRYFLLCLCCLVFLVRCFLLCLCCLVLLMMRLLLLFQNFVLLHGQLCGKHIFLCHLEFSLLLLLSGILYLGFVCILFLLLLVDLCGQFLGLVVLFGKFFL